MVNKELNHGKQGVKPRKLRLRGQGLSSCTSIWQNISMHAVGCTGFGSWPFLFFPQSLLVVVTDVLR